MNGTFNNTRYVNLSKVDDVQFEGESLVDSNRIVELSTLNTLLKDINELTNYYSKSETYSKTEVDNKISSVYKYKGQKTTYADLQAIANKNIGDVYDVAETGKNYAWNGSNWDDLGGSIDLSNYYNKTQVDNALNSLQTSLNNSINDAVSGLNIDSLNSRVTMLESSLSGIDAILDEINGEEV